MDAMPTCAENRVCARVCTCMPTFAHLVLGFLTLGFISPHLFQKILSCYRSNNCFLHLPLEL